MSNFVRKALSAALATAILGSAALVAAPTVASAQVLFAQSECINGFWHVRSYDITDPDHWILMSDEPTSQPCGGQALALDLMAGFGHALIHDVRRDERIDARRDERRDVRHDDHPVHIATRTDR